MSVKSKMSATIGEGESVEPSGAQPTGSVAFSDSVVIECPHKLRDVITLHIPCDHTSESAKVIQKGARYTVTLTRIVE
jgi:hypothetical protein